MDWAGKPIDLGTQGEVVRVKDGDTVEVKTKKGIIDVRLSETDAPEFKQKGGIEARKALENRVLNKQVTLTGQRSDQYGRTVASVDVDGHNVGKDMIDAKEVKPYGEKMSLWDRVTGKIDPKTYRQEGHGSGHWAGKPITETEPKAVSTPSGKWKGAAIDEGQSTERGIVGDIKAFGRSAIESQPALAGGVLMGEAGAAAGGIVAGPVGAVVGMLGGAVIGGILGEKAKDVVKSMIPEETLKKYGFDEKAVTQEAKEHSKSSLAGQIVGGAGWFGPGKVTVAERLFSGAFGTGIEGAEQIQKGEFDPARLAEAGVGQAIFAKSTRATKAIADKFGNTERMAAWELAKDPVAKANAKRNEYIQGQLDKHESEARVDQDGVVYHGSGVQFERFDKEKLGSNTKAQSAKEGFFFTENPDVAGSYAIQNIDERLRRGEAVPGIDLKSNGGYNFSGYIKPFKLDMKNPLVVDLKGAERTDGDFTSIIKKAKEDGHDSVILKNAHDDPKRGERPEDWDDMTEAERAKTQYGKTEDIHIVFNEDQIKPYKSKLAREKEAWVNEGKKKAAKKAEGKESTDPRDTAGRTDPGEPGSIDPKVKDVKTTGPKDESLRIEAQARKIYHTQGPEAAKNFLETNTPHAEHIVENIKNGIGININEVKAKQRLANIFKFKILKAMPSAEDRKALPKAIEEGITLSEEHAKVASDYQEMMHQIGKEAEKHGVIRGLVENYVSRMAKKAGMSEDETKGFIESIIKTPGVQAGLKPGSKFAKERTMESLDQATEAMRAKGLEIESDIAEIAHGYMTDMYKAIEDRKLVNNLKVTKIDTGYAMIPPKSTEIPYGYKVIDQGPYQGWYVHPDIKPALNFVLGAAEPGVYMKAIIAVNSAIKRSNISASLFHAKSLYEAFLLAKPYLGKEAWKGSLSGVLKVLREGGEGDIADYAIRKGGLEMGMSSVEDVSHTALEALGEQADKLMGKYSDKKIMQRGLGKLEKETLGRIDSFTWDYLHDGLKLLTFSRMLEKAERLHPDVPRDVHAKEIGRFINNSFGGLNWYDIARQSSSKFEEGLKMAAYSPEGRRYLQAILFAPDWTVSTLRAFTTALPKNLLAPDVVGGVKGMMRPKTQADYARLYQMKFALTYLTVLNGVNMITAGHPIWDNKDKTRLEFKDGTTMQATKHAMEFIHFASDTDKFISDKLGFLPKAAVVGVGGLEYAGPDAPKLEDPSLGGRAKAIGKTLLPFNVQAYQGAPEGEGLKRTILGTIGMPVYGQTKAQKAKANFERRRRDAIRKIREAQGN